MKTERINSEKWNNRFIELASHISTWSLDPSTKVGAVISEGKKLISIGYNGPPPGIDDSFALRDRDTKISCTIHAEMNAIDFSGRDNLSECTLYITHPPCDRCTAYIIKKRVGHVIFVDPDHHLRQRWNCDFSEELMTRAGIPFTKFTKSP